MSIPSTLISCFIGLASCGYMSSLIVNSLWLIAVDPHRGGSISLRPHVPTAASLLGNVNCRAASLPLSLPYRRRYHTKGTRQNSQSRCSGRPGPGRSAKDVLPRSGSFPRHIFPVLLMAEEHDGRRREGWSYACQTRRQGDQVWLQASLLRMRRSAPLCASGHHTRTFAAYVACDEHAKIRRCPGRHTAMGKDPAVLRGHEV